MERLGAGTGRVGRPCKYFLDERTCDLLRMYYDSRTVSIDRLVEMLQIPRSQIKHWAIQLGLTRTSENLEPWQIEEEEYLQTQYFRMSVEAIAKKLSRSPRAVRKRAQFLGIRKYDEGYTMRALCVALGVHNTQVEGWIKQGWLKGKRRQTAMTPDAWYFSPQAIRELLRMHPREVNPIILRKLTEEGFSWLLDIVGGGTKGLGERADPEPETE